MKRWLIGGAAAILIAIIVVVSIEAGSDEGVKVYAEPVTTKRIEAVVSAPGEIQPRLSVNVGAHIVGKIEHLYMQEGDTVKRDQKLVDLERPAYDAAYQRAEADLANRKIEVVRAKTALETSKLEYNRALNMQKQGIQTQELLDKARLDLQNAQAGSDSAVEGVRQGEATLVSARTDLEHTTIVSPIDGKVVQLNAHEGEVVVTGTMNNPASVIAVVADLSEILVEADVPETEVVGITAGMPAKVKVDAVPDKEYDARVVEIGSSASIKTGTGSGMRYFKVKAQIVNPDDRLRPGMTAQASIITSTAPNALTVPIQSVVERLANGKVPDDENAPRKKYVFVIKGNVVKMTPVTTGISDATHVAITSGLQAREQVVTGPFRTLKKLKDGDKVQVTKEEPKKGED